MGTTDMDIVCEIYLQILKFINISVIPEYISLSKLFQILTF